MCILLVFIQVDHIHFINNSASVHGGAIFADLTTSSETYVDLINSESLLDTGGKCFITGDDRLHYDFATSPIFIETSQVRRHSRKKRPYIYFFLYRFIFIITRLRFPVMTCSRRRSIFATTVKCRRFRNRVRTFPSARPSRRYSFSKRRATASRTSTTCAFILEMESAQERTSQSESTASRTTRRISKVYIV